MTQSEATPTPTTNHNEEYAKVAKSAENKWPYIFEDLAPELGNAMASAPYHVACPVHGGADGFRLFNDYAKTGGGVCNSCGPRPRGFSMLAWVKGYQYREAVEAVAAWLAENGEDTPQLKQRAPVPPPKPLVDPAKAYASIRKVWTSSLALQATAAERYLCSRGIWPENIPKTLRAHPGLNYFEVKTKTDYGVFPCLLAPIKDKDNRIVSLHRTFLTEEGRKANVPSPKKVMSACAEIRGAAIKLFEPGETLGLTEGIETALAVYAITRMPVWSCVSAALLELVEIPAHVKHVVIWADLDRSGRGLQAAEKLADRLEKEGKTVEIYLPHSAIPPESKGVDWLDVINRNGINGFPAKWRCWRPPTCAQA